MKIMLISYKHKFIFIHSRKTAGSSIKSYLSSFLGPNDILVGAWKDIIKKGGKINKRFIQDILHPRVVINWRTWKVIASLMVKKIELKDGLNTIHKKSYKQFRNPGHQTAKEIKNIYRNEWKNFYKFCFVRNPYEKEVSDYKWRSKKAKKSYTFKEFLERKLRNDLKNEINEYPPTNKPMYKIDGSVVVDYIGRYENIHDDLLRISRKIGIPFRPSDLPKAKKSEDYNYETYYDEEKKKMVEHLYKGEIEKLGYCF